jgi:carbamoyl-phosphate synthase large subunit
MSDKVGESYLMQRQASLQTVLALEAGGPASMAAMHQLRDSGLPLRIIGADMDPNSAAHWLADEFYPVLPASSPGYAQEIADLIKEHEVSAVLPSFHFGMKEISELKTPVFLNDFIAGLLCQDKWEFYKWCLDKGYDVPQTSLLGSDSVPDGALILKPRFGAGAKGNFIVKDQELPGLQPWLQARDEYLAQEFIIGEQWVVDAMRHADNFVGCTTARVDTHRTGHAVAVEVQENPELTDLTQNILEDLDYDGPANLDVIKDTAGKYVILEVNPRFGGTIRFSHAAGVNWPAYLLSGQEKFVNKPIEGKYSILSRVVRLELP